MTEMTYFNSSSYRSILEAALERGFHFYAFNDPEIHTTEQPACLLRHDIDVSLKAAFEIAQVDALYGIQSTFFVMLRSPIYNLFSRANSHYMEQILSLGHHLGLHFDEGFRPVHSAESLDERIEEEADTLSRYTGAPVTAVSFHIPCKQVLQSNIKLRKYINTYNKEDLKGFYYLSDSSREWRDRTPLELFTDTSINKVHLLLHPIWWTRPDGLQNTPQYWDHALLETFEQMEEQLLATERNYGEKRQFLIQLPETAPLLR
jgi:AAA+ ATPase superfamily predicted ATPase